MTTKKPVNILDLNNDIIEMIEQQYNYIKETEKNKKIYNEFNYIFNYTIGYIKYCIPSNEKIEVSEFIKKHKINLNKQINDMLSE